MNTWTEVAHYGDSSGDYYIDVNADLTRMRTAWSEDRADAIVQVMTREADRDDAPAEERDVMTDRYALGGDVLLADGITEGWSVYLDGQHYILTDTDNEDAPVLTLGDIADTIESFTDEQFGISYVGTQAVLVITTDGPEIVLGLYEEYAGEDAFRSRVIPGDASLDDAWSTVREFVQAAGDLA